MTRTVFTGAVVAALAALLAVGGGALGITTLWPVLLAVAVGLAAGSVSFGRISAYVLGAVVSLLAMAVQAAVLPDVAGARAAVVVVGVLLLTGIAAITRDRVSLWAGLAGYAAFAALYEPRFAEAPTAFLADAPVAFVTVLLAAALGVAAVSLAELLASGSRREAPASDELVEGGVA